MNDEKPGVHFDHPLALIAVVVLTLSFLAIVTLFVVSVW